MTSRLLNNRYQILKTIGRGGFGETFLAVDTHIPSSRKCVIKQLQPSVNGGKIPTWLKERFQREAAVLEELGDEHEQIPRLYAYFAENENFYLIQQWIKGITLSQWQKQNNISEAEVQALLLALLPVLHFIHQRRIIHRDIKPENIILRASDGKPVLIDFGIVKEAIATAIPQNSKFAQSAVLGTPGYMSSEQAAGRPVYSSDLYSLGLTAIFLLTGKTPQQLTHDPHTGEVLWKKELSSLSSNLAEVLEQATQFHPRDRFASASDMYTALVANSSPQTGDATVAVAPETLHLSKRVSNQQSPTPQPNTMDNTDHDWEEKPPQNPWVGRFLLAALLVGTIGGGVTLGYRVIQQRLTSPDNVPIPEENFESVPESVPSVAPSKAPVPTRPRQPTEPRPTRPKATVSPKPRNTISPKPETPVKPKPKATLKPDAVAPVSPQPSPTVTPSPKPESETPKKPEATQPIPIPIQPQPSPAVDSPASPEVEPASPPDTSVIKPPTTEKPPAKVAPTTPNPAGGIRPEPPPAPPQPKATPQDTLEQE